MKRLTLLSITTLALFTACTPTATDPASQPKITVDGFDIKPGQTWEIKAWGGDGWKDGGVFTVGSQYRSAHKVIEFSGSGMVVALEISNPEYGYPVNSLSFNWNATYPQLNNSLVFCAIRDPKLSLVNPSTFKGRWAASFTRLTQYLKSGDETGTGECTATLVLNRVPTN